MRGNYPDGCVTYRGGGETTLVCVNEACPEYGEPVDVRTFWELGATYLHNEDEHYCSQCEKERVDSYDFKLGLGTKYTYPEDLT